MKINHNVAATLVAMLASGLYRMPPSATSGNRLHSERARAGSAEEVARLETAELKRARKRKRMAAQRARSQSSGEVNG